MKIDDLCRELNNWFDRNSDGTNNRYFGIFTIENGEIDLSETDIQNNQYFRIVGSVLNDGVYQYPASDLTDETFDGAVWLMKIPTEIFRIMKDINAWETKYGGADSIAASPFQSESFGGYSYAKTMNVNSMVTSGDDGSWQKAFQSRLNKWRKIRA